MIEVSRLLLMILAELLLLGMAYAGVVTFLFLSKRRRERAAIKKLIARIRQDSDRRGAETRQILQQRYGLSGAALEEAVHKIVREEKGFYQTLIDLFLRRDTEALQNLAVDYEKSVETYRSIELPVPEVAEPAPTADAPDHSEDELALLKAENQRLAEELQLTMDTMGTMLSEYTQMFAGGADVSLDREKLRQIIAPAEELGSVLSGARSGKAAPAGPDTDGTDAGAETTMESFSAERGVPDSGEPAPVEDDPAAAAASEEADPVAPDSEAGSSGEANEEEEEVVNLDDVLEDPGTLKS